MKLTKEDFSELLKIDRDSKRVVSLDVFKRLHAAGLMDEDQSLTAEGCDKIEQINETLNRLKKGVPFTSRKQRDPKKVFAGDDVWLKKTIAKKVILTNREIVLIGPVPRELKTVKVGDDDIRKALIKIIQDADDGEYTYASPVFFQTNGTLDDPLELVWLSVSHGGSERRKLAMQAKYYDYLEKRWPSGKLAVDFDNKLILMEVDKGGVTDRNIVAMVRGVELGKSLKEPK